LKSIWHRENGAVSVYLILIIVPIFLFQAVLIDFARIKLAEKETEAAVKAGVRSSLSAFDTELQANGLYGLGVSTEEALNIFSNVFGKNLSGSIVSGAFHFVDTVPVPSETRLTPVYSLASHTIFERQILEDMKLKAPIEFALEITDKFKKSGASAPFQSASQFSKDGEAVEKLLDKRNEVLDRAWSQAMAMHDKTVELHSRFDGYMNELSSLAEIIGIHSVDEIQNSLVNIRAQIKSIQDSIQALDGTLSSIVQAGEQSMESIASIIQSKQVLQNQLNDLAAEQNELDKILKALLKYAGLLIQFKHEAESESLIMASYQVKMEPLLMTAKQTNDELRVELERIMGGSDGSNKLYDAFKSVKVLNDDYFHSYSSSVAAVLALFNGFQSTISSINLFTMANTNRAKAANDAYENIANEFYVKQAKIEEERMGARDQLTANKQAQKNKIQAVLDQAKLVMDGCSSNDQSFYKILQEPEIPSEKGLYQKYRYINNQGAGIGSGVVYDLDKSDKVSLKAMDMLGAFANIAEGSRNELYLNEFALTKFNYRTYGFEKDIKGQPKTSNERINPGSHKLALQEVEYLLYGFSSCQANISSAYAEMFSFRLAIRTLEALLDPKKELLNAGSPLLVLLAAAAEGAAKAFMDMSELVKGNQVELSSKLASSVLTLTYKDYLRIFLLLHSNDTNLMARMQALIELNTGKDLQNQTTYVQGHATSTVRLWFIPGIMRLISGSDLLGCRVNMNRCEITRTSALSY
jgi:flagellar biosynthesis regulator FlaF